MIKAKKLVIVGVGEIANMAYEYFTYDSEYEVAAFSVNKCFIKENVFRELRVVALEELTDAYSPDEYFVFVAIGEKHLNRDRANVCENVKKLGYKLVSYVSSKAFIWHNVKIGENCFILENNTLQPFVSIGDNVTLWSGNHIGHQTKIDNNCFITSQVVISGMCEIGANTYIGVNATIANNIKLAKDNFIGMGAVIGKNTLENTVYTGNPAVASNVSALRLCKVKEQ